MRYYRISITDQKTGKLYTPLGFGNLLGDSSYTSFVNGQTLPGAWDVEIDIQVAPGLFTGNSTVKVWGISLPEVSQANDLSGKNIKVYAGMQAGLPLANPRQSGLVCQGQILQSYGNWIGANMTLDLVIVPPFGSSSDAGGPGTTAAPKNIVLDWKANQPLSMALQSALQTAFPNAGADVSISSQIVRPNNDPGVFPSLEQLAQYVFQASRDVVKDAGYSGVRVWPSPNGKIVARDSTTAGDQEPVMINFADLVGQPTWIGPGTIQVKTVMRGDLDINRRFTMPPTQVTNTQQANSSLVNQRAAFQGTFLVQNLRHVGRYRQPTADGWVTVIDGTPEQPLQPGKVSLSSANG